MGHDKASPGTSASSPRANANRVPATSAMCRPEMERMCERPDTRMLSSTARGMPERSPATSATATSAGTPESEARMRSDRLWRTPSSAMASRTDKGGSRGAAALGRPSP